ncbi:hypothetical protein IWQ49_006684 [Labrenzia sp. EL_126]|nr:hypothetical protein [Labrenzia sp. EL_126]
MSGGTNIGDFAVAFVAGFTKPSGLAAAIMIGVFVLSVAFAAWFFSPSTLAGPLGAYLPRSAQDAEGFVTRATLHLANRTATKPRLVILGSSVLAQAFGASPQLTPPEQKWSVHMLTTPLQSPFDQIAIVENLLATRGPEDPLLVVSIGVGLQRLGWDAVRLTEMEHKARLGLRSDMVDTEMKDLGHAPRMRFGVWAMDNYRFVFTNGTEALTRLMLDQPAIWRTDSFALGEVVPPEARNRDIIEKRIRDGQTHAADYFALLRRMIDVFQAAPGVEVVLIEESLSPDFLKATDLTAAATDLRKDFVAFAQDVGVEFWPIMSTAGLEATDYHDDLHIRRAAAQEKVRATFARYFDNFSRTIEITE